MRLKALFTMSFSEEYRQDLVTHGATRFIHEGEVLVLTECTRNSFGKEYQNISGKLGAVPDSAHSMRWGIPQAWYWTVLGDLVAYSPLVCPNRYRLPKSSSFSVRLSIF